MENRHAEIRAGGVEMMNPNELIADLCASVMIDSSRAWAVLEALGGRVAREGSMSKQGGAGRVVSGEWPNGHPVHSYRDVTRFENLAAFCRYKGIIIELNQTATGNSKVQVDKLDRESKHCSVLVRGKTPSLTLAAALVKLERKHDA
jgi:hypothetical protein